MDLFDPIFNESSSSLKKRSAQPLYSKVRPKDLHDLIGQKSILPIINLINNDKLPSLILWGPPGCGKTTFAHVIKNKTEKDFVFLSAVLSGKKELKETCERAKQNLKFKNRQTILFIDEIHRFNKAQQDALLPHLEDGTFTLIGATTENPGFEVIPALLSRCKLITFDPLSEKDLFKILTLTLDKEKLIDRIEESAIEKICSLSAGDARYAINLLQTCLDNIEQKEKISSKKIETLLNQKNLQYDKNGENHYNYISAFIKSVRGSDANAAVYYLACMLKGGEDPKFIARRLIILASEDIGNADPRALTIAVSGFSAVHNIGMPEARIILSQVTTYLATAPKSNASYMAINSALEDVSNSQVFPPPLHLRNPVNSVMKKEGYGENYKYAHDYPYNIADQNHMPEKLKNKTYYTPTQNGYEKTISERLKFWEKMLKENKER